MLFFLVASSLLGFTMTVFGDKRGMMIPPIVLCLIPLPIFIIICMICKTFWYWTSGKHLYEMLPTKNSSQLLVFNISIFLPILLYVGSFCYFFILISSGGYNKMNQLISPSYIVVVCLFYSIYFNARNLKKLESGDEAHPFLQELVLFAFPFFSVWNLQKRIQAAIQ